MHLIQNANETSEVKSAIYIGKDKLLKRLYDYRTATNEICAQYMKSDKLNEKQSGIILGSLDLIYRLILDVHSGALDYDGDFMTKHTDDKNEISYNSDKELLDALYSGQHLNEKDIMHLLLDLGCVVDEQKGDQGIWTQRISTIIQLPDPNDLDTYTDDLWRIDWLQCLTVLQESEFDEQPYRVKCVEETVVVKNYVRIDE